MKKFIWGIIMLCAFTFVSNVKANTVHNINMDIYIDAKGTAHVTEVWNATLTSGTEGYKPYYNLGNSAITNFSVSDETKQYTNIGTWNTSGSMSTKAYKSGLNYISNGVELCFGISEYGTHTYTMKYDITNFVVGLTDADMVYWQLFPYDFSAAPDNIYIKMYADQAFADTLDVWGYGNYGGYAYVYDGYIEMSTDGRLGSDEYMTILVKFPKGTFDTSNNVLNNDFNHYLKMAEEGATHYTENKKNKVFEVIFTIFSFLFNVCIWGFIAYIIYKSSQSSGSIGGFYFRFNKGENKLPKDIPLYRDIPCNKDIYRVYWIASVYKLIKNKTDFLGAILLKWLKEGKIKITKVESKILKREETAIEMIPGFTSSLDFETKLYNMMFEASADGILESKEFEKWCKKNYSEILSWFNDVLRYQTEELINEGKIEVVKTGKFLSSEKYIVSTSLFEEGKQVKGLKNFLIEFSKIDDREAIEVALWEEYLMIAQILGIADKVAKQFKKLYPEVITDYSYDSVIFVHNVSYSGMHSATSAKSAAEARASSYSSGGGGFSSGGGGGGSFGGGGGGGGFR